MEWMKQTYLYQRGLLFFKISLVVIFLSLLFLSAIFVGLEPMTTANMIRVLAGNGALT